jgi:holin-like protein
MVVKVLIKQFLIILAALFTGYILSLFLHLPIPANVIGFLLLFFALCTGLIKLKHVDKVSDFIIEYLAVFFVVPGVGIMLYFDLIYTQFVKIIMPLGLSIILGYFAAGKVTELTINFMSRKKLPAEQKSPGEKNERVI